MDKVKVKVIDFNIGIYDCDSITAQLDGKKTEICFDKKDNISQYNGKEIYLSKKNDVFVIEPIEYVIKK